MNAMVNLVIGFDNFINLLVYLLLHTDLPLVDQSEELVRLDSLLASQSLYFFAEAVRFRFDQAVSVEDFPAPIFRVTVDATIIFDINRGLDHIEENFRVVHCLVRADNVLHAGQDHELVFE